MSKSILNVIKSVLMIPENRKCYSEIIYLIQLFNTKPFQAISMIKKLVCIKKK